MVDPARDPYAAGAAYSTLLSMTRCAVLSKDIQDKQVALNESLAMLNVVGQYADGAQESAKQVAHMYAPMAYFYVADSYKDVADYEHVISYCDQALRLDDCKGTCFILL